MIRSRVEPLRRPRLEALADRVLQARLTLLVAPPGSGKTVLLDQWQRRLGADASVVRLELGFEHNDAERFRDDLVASALDELPLLRRRSGSIEPIDITGFLEAMIRRERPERPLVFVFDRFDLISDTIISDTLMAALQLSPENVHLVLASRTEPNLLLSGLRAAGRVLEVGTGDLALTPGEVRDLSAHREAELTEAQWTRLADDSLGWAAVVAATLGSATDRERVLAEYFEDEVLAGLTPSERRALEESAVFERVTLSEAEQVLDPETVACLSWAADPANGRPMPFWRRSASGWEVPPLLRAHLLRRWELRDPEGLRALRARFAGLNGHRPLSSRESEILSLLAGGLTIAGIANELSISFHTAKTHIRSIYEKLGVSTRVLAVHRARRFGLIGEERPSYPRLQEAGDPGAAAPG